MGEPRTSQNRPRVRARAADVAARAGVSIATVSLVANGKARGRVSAATHVRVEQAIAELGYVVDPTARNLVTGRRSCIALLAHDMTNPFISLIAAGVARAVGTETQLLLAVGGAQDPSPDLARIAAFGVDGILVDYPASEQLGRLALDVPVVHLDDPDADEGLPRAYFDVAAGAAQLAEHLAGLGHQRVVYLDATRPWPTFGRRRTELAEELTRLAPGACVLRAHSDIEIAAAQAVVHGCWAEWDAAGVTAVVAASDVQGWGVLAALGELGVPVPGRVSVASFDSLPFSALTAPALTSVELPAEELGRSAAELLLDLIDHPGDEVRTAVLPASLQVRASTGAAVTLASNA